MKKKVLLLVLFSFFTASVSGCAFIRKAQRADDLEIENARLKRSLEELEAEKAKEKEEVLQEKEEELSELERAKQELERALKNEIGEYKAKLQMTERGLVITFLAEIFFDSGRAEIRADGKESLQKVAAVLQEDVPVSLVAVEGHTDTDPIKRSGWQSNWELSSARALAVLHYFVDECGIKPERLSANAYGEYRPVASNDTPEDKQKNRRVEIVILPSNINKAR